MALGCKDAGTSWETYEVSAIILILVSIPRHYGHQLHYRNSKYSGNPLVKKPRALHPVGKDPS